MTAPVMGRQLVVAFGLLGLALWFDNGALGPVSLPLVAAACAIVGWTIAGRGFARRFGIAEAVALVLVVEAVLPWLKPPGVYLDDAAIVPRLLVTIVALGGTAAALRGCSRGWLLLAGMIALAGAAGLLVVRGSPSPVIDVFTLQQEGARALWQGGDPYGGPFTNPYTAEQTLAFFGAPHAHLEHYPYPPLSLYATALGWRVTGDVRHVLLLAQLVTSAALYGIARRVGARGGLALGFAALFLAHPRGLFMLEQSWTEPLICAGFACVVLLLVSPPSRAQRLALVGCLAWFFAAKQYSVLLLPMLLARRFAGPSRTALVVALGIAAAIAIPLLVADRHAMFDDVVMFQVRQPFRWASLSIAPVIAFLSGWQPALLSPVAAVAAAAWSWRRVPRGTQGMCLVASATLLAFFVTAKQAFCNYYYFAGLVLLCAAITSWREDAPADPAPTPAA